jgi:hypothetical protein
MSDLVALAKRYVDLTAEIESVRVQMRAALFKGARHVSADAERADPRPTPAGVRPAGKRKPKPPSRETVMAASAAADDAVIRTLKRPPRMQLGEIVRAVAGKPTTVQQHLKRLQAKGLVERSGNGWAATSSP